jgi:xylitol oxidase
MMNWAGNHRYRAGAHHRPESLEQVQELVRRLPRVRALGSRHSFNDIGDTPGDLISLDRYPRSMIVDSAGATVTVDGGMRYGDLCGPLEQAGFALHNLASLPHISIAGACTTATHGSGVSSGNLATAVAAMSVVSSDGEVVRFAREQDADELAGAVVGLGGLGVVTELTLDVVPAYRMRQDVYEDLSFASVEEHFEEISAAAESVSFFTGWGARTFEQVWLKRRVTDEPYEAEPELRGARLARRPLHPIAGLPADVCTQQLGVPGPWHERLPHFRMEHTPSSGDELQSEYIVDRRHTVPAILAIAAIGRAVAPVVQVSEVRTIAEDDLWMSPSFARSSVAIHFTWQPDADGVRGAMGSVEAALAPFDPRPHWGKLSTIAAATVAASYRRRPAFRDLLTRYDPDGKFRNAFLDRYVFGDV